MKKFKIILVLLTMILFIPISTFAEEGVVENNEVKLYFFHGDGCGYCEKAKEWFTEIENEYGSKFEVVSYEVWYNEENSQLMTTVAEARKEDVGGVPYIIVGNQSWNGFADEYKEEILAKIDSEYNTAADERYDIMDFVDAVQTAQEESNTVARDILILLVFAIVVGGVTFGLVKARKNVS